MAIQRGFIQPQGREERDVQVYRRKREYKPKDSWFIINGFTSTLTVPVTPTGVLAEKVRANLAKGRLPTGTRTKLKEDGGLCTENVL